MSTRKQARPRRKPRTISLTDKELEDLDEVGVALKRTNRSDLIRFLVLEKKEELGALRLQPA